MKKNIEKINNYTISTEVLTFITQNVPVLEDAFVTNCYTKSNIERLSKKKYTKIINLNEINNFLHINKYLQTINNKLPLEGLFIGNVETYTIRKNRLLRKYIKPFNYIYYFFDFLLTRISPKLKLTKNLYFYLTKRKKRVLSKTETLGRLCYCGFKIVAEELINDRLYFVAKKIENNKQTTNKNYGLLIKLNRIGKNGKEIQVYKLRTMHPYSEYLQEYVYSQNKLQEGGKLKNDFRISPEGRVFRKFWIDELPMIINILKGDMKLVGVRPLSPHFFSLYTPDLQDLRTKFKPGFIPPFYVDLPKTMDEIMESERNYLEAYQKAPFKTDLRYLYLSLKNVIIKGARSN